MRLSNFLLFSVLCLVNSAIIDSVGAVGNVTAIESLLENAMTKIKDEMLKSLETYKITQAAEKRENKTDQIADLITNMSATDTNLLASQTELLKQLLLMNNNLQASQSDLVKQLMSINNDLQVSQSDLQKQLMNKNNDLLAIQSDLQTQLRRMKDDLDQYKINLIPTSCETLSIKATNTYYIRPYGTGEKPFLVLCDFEDYFKLGGGWTVFQNRIDGNTDFYQNWTMYKNGFGDVNGEHWLGLEKLHAMSRSGKYELLVVLEDFIGNSKYALYDNFSVGNETDKYKLTIGNYSGTAGDSFKPHNGMYFSTFDQDNDLKDGNCSEKYKGAWWFANCHQSHLNGEYRDSLTEADYAQGLIWLTYHGYYKPIKSTRMMLRRRISSKS